MYSPRVQIVCPAKPGTRHGNRVTALRWQRILRELSCPTKIVNEYDRGSADVLVALHARRSAPSVATFHQQHPGRPVVLALTGTDLYRDLRTSEVAQTALRTAHRLVVLQDAALQELTPALRRKTRVIFQSVTPVRIARPTLPRQLRVIVAGHLRDVKDPFRTAMAVRNLPAGSRIVVDHYGAAMEQEMGDRARQEMRRNRRYRWHGEVPRGVLRRHLARGWLMVLSSKMEGGANVLSEALANHTPVIASRIPGSVGMMGTSYSGYFEVGNTGQLRTLLRTCETDNELYEQLCRQTAERAFLVTPEREIAAWRCLLAELRRDFPLSTD